MMLLITLSLASCSSKSDDKEYSKPIFKLLSFTKTKVGSLYRCEATILISGITDKYSIDGLLKTNSVPSTELTIEYSDDNISFYTIYNQHIQLGNNNSTTSTINYNIYEKYEGAYYFNLYGTHHGDIKLKLKFTSNEDYDNYIVGWHLSYGFGPNCSVMMVNLEK